MIITLSGSAGSGKSSVATYVAKKLKFHHYSTGDFMRELATERGLTILELSALSERDPSIDRQLDQRQVTLGKTKDRFVMDSRLGFYFIPHSFKVYLDATLLERAKRIFSQQRASERNLSLEETKENIRRRLASEQKRYKKLYGIDYTDPENYDLTIDTSKLTIQKVGDQIISAFAKKFAQEQKKSKRA